MIYLDDFLKIVNYEVTEGYKFLWKCYGVNAYSYSHWNSSHGITVSIVFDTMTRQAFEMQAWDDKNNRQYRWIHPGYIESFITEAISRNVNYKLSYDNNKFIDIECIEDILEKASAIFLKEEYDQRILMPLDFSEEELYRFMLLAHKEDITLNQLITRALETQIELMELRKKSA